MGITKKTNNYYNGGIGSYAGFPTAAPERKYTIVQSLWTKPFTNLRRLRDELYIAAISLEYAHRSGYKVHMHTDSKGMQLLKNYGYEKLLPTLDSIPDSVPVELFAAGKFFAFQAEGTVGKLHIDTDVLLKNHGVLDRFYEDSKVDVMCQMEEDMPLVNHSAIIADMHILGYPASTRPDWNGSMNTGVIGFNNQELAAKYFGNYFDALSMYTQEQFDAYKEENPKASLKFDFILEQVNLSRMSIGYNVVTLVPTKDPSVVADKIGYQHLQGDEKWSAIAQVHIKSNLSVLNWPLLKEANAAAAKARI